MNHLFLHYVSAIGFGPYQVINVILELRQCHIYVTVLSNLKIIILSINVCNRDSKQQTTSDICDVFHYISISYRA